MASGDNGRITLTISERGELRPLRDWLARIHGVHVEQHSAPGTSGELGLGDYLAVTATAVPVLVAAIRTLPDFVRSRRRTLTISTKVTDDKGVTTETTISGENLDDEATRRLLGG
jgi:hypothetical protein